MTTFADSIVATLQAAVPAGVAVYDAMVPGIPPARYVVCYITSGVRGLSSISPVSDNLSLSFQTTTVASDPNPALSAVYCRWLAILVRDTLTDRIITADGYSPARILHEGSESARPDETTPDKKVYATDQFMLTSVRIS